jgi:hypothetical protein
MKIAVCISGNLRNFEKMQSYWVSKKAEGMDLFLSIWDYRGHKINNTHPAFKTYHTYDYEDKIIFSRGELKNFGFSEVEIEKYYPEFNNRFEKELEPLFSIRNMNNDYDPFVDNTTASSVEHSVGFLSMWYKRWKCFELLNLYSRMSGINYDMICIGRSDMSLATNIEKLSNDVLHIPYFTDRDASPDFAVGPFELIREYCMVYPRFWRFCRELGMHRTGVIPGVSFFLHEYIRILKLPVEKHLNDSNFSLQKPNMYY